MNTTSQSHSFHQHGKNNLNNSTDIALLLLLTVLITVNAYLAHYVTIQHPKFDDFDDFDDQMSFVLVSALGLPFAFFAVSFCFASMRSAQTIIKVLTVSSVLVFLSNVPLILVML